MKDTFTRLLLTEINAKTKKPVRSISLQDSGDLTTSQFCEEVVKVISSFYGYHDDALLDGMSEYLESHGYYSEDYKGE